MEGSWSEWVQGDGWLITRPANIPFIDAWLNSHCRCQFKPEVLLWTLCDDGQQEKLMLIVILGKGRLCVS